MKPLIVEFRRHWTPSRWMWWALAVLATAVIAAGCIVAHDWRMLQSQQMALQEALASKAAPQAKPPTIQAPVPYAASAQAMLAEHTSPWPQALTAIESAAIVGVTPVGFEFVTNEQRFRLEVNFADYAKLLEYLDALNSVAGSIEWKLVQAQSTGVATAVIAGTVIRD